MSTSEFLRRIACILVLTLCIVLPMSCQSNRVPMVQTTTTAKGITGGDVTTTTQAPYESPWDKASGDALRTLFSE